MSDLVKPDPAKPESPLKLLLIEDDPIFRMGLRSVMAQFPDLQVVAEAESSEIALHKLANAQLLPDLTILDLGLARLSASEMTGLELCQQLKTQYPQMRLLVLSSVSEPVLLATARQMGVDGYCPKGIAVSELVNAIRLVAAGEFYWHSQSGKGEVTLPLLSPQPNSPTGLLPTLLNHIRLSGLRQIESALAEVTAELQTDRLSLLDRAIVAGRQRELKAARALVQKLLGKADISTEILSSRSAGERFLPQNSSSPQSPVPSAQSLVPKRSLLFESTFAKIQGNLQNLSPVPLEIDIFTEDKKRELLILVLRKLEDTLANLRFSQVEPSQLSTKKSTILEDLWQATTNDFFGKYYTLQLGESQLVIVDNLLQDAPIVKAEILEKIPLVVDLFAHLLFQAPLIVDNLSYAAETAEAMARAELILQNLAIQVANGVVQPLLNNFADVEIIKQNFYDRSLISSRDIEKFRNDLSWRYRVERYVGEPTAIFESKYNLLVFNGNGIKQISIYYPRSEELAQLSGIPLGVTLALEIRDAIAPRFRALVAFAGSGVVYVLTQVIGRGIGLIGRGILEGIGNSWQENRLGRNSDRK